MIALGRPIIVTDRLDRPTIYGYDSNGSLQSISRPTIGAATYTRNALGILTQSTDFRGQNWRYGYTPMGRATRPQRKPPAVRLRCPGPALQHLLSHRRGPHPDHRHIRDQGVDP